MIYAGNNDKINPPELVAQQNVHTHLADKSHGGDSLLQYALLIRCLRTGHRAAEPQPGQDGVGDAGFALLAG